MKTATLLSRSVAIAVTLVLGGAAVATTLWVWLAWSEKTDPCGTTRQYELDFRTRMQGVQTEQVLPGGELHLRSDFTTTLLHRSEEGTLERWSWSSQIERPIDPALNAAFARVFQGELLVERNAQGVLTRLHRPMSQSIGTANALKNLAFAIQFSIAENPRAEVEEPAANGWAQFQYGPASGTATHRKQWRRWVRAYPSTSFPKIFQSEVTARYRQGGLEWQEGTQKTQAVLLDASQPITSDSSWTLNLRRRELQAPESCRLSARGDFIRAADWAEVPFFVQMDPDAERSALREKTKGVTPGSLTAAWNPKRGDQDQQALQSRLTDLVSVDAQAARDVAERVRSETNPAKRRFLIGALGGATGEAAQAALLELVEEFARGGDREWLGFALRANQFSPEPASPNLAGLWRLSQDASLHPEDRAGALYAVATASQRAASASERELYVDRVLELAQAPNTQSEITAEAVGNLAHARALPFFQERAVQAESRGDTKALARAVDGMRLIEGPATERVLLLYSAHTDPNVQETAYRSLRNRTLSEESVRQLVAVYDSPGRNPEARQSVLLILAEPANQGFPVAQDLIHRIRSRPLEPFEKNILGEKF